MSLGGTVTPQAAERTGLPAGIPVLVGMIDVAITGPGLGAIKDGDSWLILGTTGFIGTLLPSVAQRHSELSMVLATGRGHQVRQFLATDDPLTWTGLAHLGVRRLGCGRGRGPQRASR